MLVKVDNMYSTLNEVILDLKDGMNDPNVYEPRGRIVNGKELNILYFFENNKLVKKGLKTNIEWC
jgi:hypothetical protein